MTYGPYKGVVDKVQDGDTIYVRCDVGFDLTVYTRCRIQGINAPELSTDGGKLAREYAQTLLPVGAQVDVTSHNWDKYGGRIDADITFTPPAGMSSSTDFATAMIAAGQAVRYTA